MSRQFANFIDGEWAESPDVSRNINPSNLGDIISEFSRADAQQAVRAIRAGADALRTWSVSTPQQRSTGQRCTASSRLIVPERQSK